MRPRIEPSTALLRLASLQEGVLSLDQAGDHGLGRHSVARLVREQRWRPLGRGVYHLDRDHPTWTALAWAGVLIGGPGARVGGLGAAFLHDLRERPPREVEIWLPPDVRLRDSGCWRFRRDTANVSRTPHGRGSPPRTTVEETVLDLAAELDEDDLVALAIRVVQERRTTPSRLQTALSSRRRIRHRTLLQAVLGEVREGVESPLERYYLRDVERPHGLPRGRRQHRIIGARRDVLYRQYRALVELDGRFHEGAGRFLDMRRDNAAMLSDARTLRFGWPQVVGQPCAVSVQVAQLLTMGGWSGGWSGGWHRCQRCRSVPDVELFAA